MTEGIRLVRFFLGANTPRGFVSRFDQLERQKDGWTTYIIKGGPGSGKSTLMKNIEAALGDRCGCIEEIYCSSDSSSLDGLILHDLKVSIADGTPPHMLEPKYPGAYDEIINLCDCWDSAKLRESRKEIIGLSRKIHALHAQSTRFLNAFAALQQDNTRIALEYTDKNKISAYARRLAARELHAQRSGLAHEDVRFLSGICERGVVIFEETAQALAQRIYIIDDEYGASSCELLSHLRDIALSRGLDIISCYCPSDPEHRLEHLFIPSLSLGFMTSNRVHPLHLEPYRVLHARRFMDMEGLKTKKQYLTFNRKAAQEMLAQSQQCLKNAKELHDELESFYIRAMQFDKLDACRAETVRRLS